MSTICNKSIDDTMDKLDNCKDMFLAIGNENRLLILIALVHGNQNGMRVGEISDAVHMNRSAVSKHLRVLMDAGIVTLRKEETKNFYSILKDDTNWKLLEDFVSHVCEGFKSYCNSTPK